MRELTCIVCPKGCHLQVDEENGQVCFTVESLGYYIVSPILMTE